MAGVITESTGTQTTTGAEDVLGTINLNRILVGTLDVTNMAGADTIVIRAYRKVVVAGALVKVYERTLSGVQVEKGHITLPIPSPFQYRLTVQRTGGSDRAYPWAIESMA